MPTTTNFYYQLVIIIKLKPTCKDVQKPWKVQASADVTPLSLSSWHGLDLHLHTFDLHPKASYFHHNLIATAGAFDNICRK